MKQITYRGGLVNFRIPKIWVEEYEADGGGTFYQDHPDSGTLRLNVLTMVPPSGSEPGSPLSFLQSSSYAVKGEVRELPSGAALLTAMNSSIEGSIPIHMHYWHIAQRVGTTHLRIAMFTYTIRAGQESNPFIAHELRMLHQELPQASLSIELGFP